MYLKQRSDFIAGSTAFTIFSNATAAAPVSSEIRFSDIPRDNPIDKINIYVTLTGGAAVATACAEGLAKVLKQVQFVRNGVAGRGQVTVVNCDGASLIERQYQLQNIDRITQAAITTTPAANSSHVFCYTLDLANDQLDDPLRSYTLCPVHLDGANPTLVLNFASQAELDTNGTPTWTEKLRSVEIEIIRREMPPELNKQIIENGGYMEMDMIEREQTITATGEVRITLEAPGEYESVLFRPYTAAATRADITDSTQKTWSLSQAGGNPRKFRYAHLQAANDRSRICPTIAAGMFSSSSMLDFISDQQGAPDNNLGSLLNTNLADNNGQKTEIVFNATGGAAVKLRYLGRRILSAIGARRFQFGG